MPAPTPEAFRRRVVLLARQGSNPVARVDGGVYERTTLGSSIMPATAPNVHRGRSGNG